MSYEKDQLASFITSASVSTALAAALVPYVTSNSLSAAIAGLDLAPYVTSNSLSAAVATDALTVRGAASVSATLSAGAITLAGRPVGAVLLGYQNLTTSRGFTYSGSWSDYCVLKMETFILTGSGGTNTTLNDGSDILSNGSGGTAMSGKGYHEATIFGTDGAAHKLCSIYLVDNVNGTRSFNTTSTANSSFVTHINFSITGTASLLISALYGWRKS